MSTSALASARRRRTTTETPSPPTSGSISKPVQKDSPREQNQTLTPLQILQLHDLKLKELEIIFTEFTDEELLSKFIDEKLEAHVFSNSLGPIDDEKFRVLEKKIDDKIELQNIKIAEFKTSLQQTINAVKDENTNIMKYLNDTIQNQIASNNLLNNKLIDSKFERFNNIENIITEFNELKLLVIKSQNLALETANSVNRLNEQCTLNTMSTKALEENMTLFTSRKNDDSTNIMLQSLLGGSLFKSRDLNSFAFNNNDGGDCGECEEDTNLDYIKKLNIDFNNNELLLSEEQIADLLDVKSTTIIDNNISIDKIIVDNDTILQESDFIKIEPEVIEGVIDVEAETAETAETADMAETAETAETADTADTRISEITNA